MAEPSTMNSEKNCNYLHYIELPLKLVACWEWFPKPTTLKQVITNNIYLCLVLSALVRFAVGLSVHIYTEWTNIMSCLHEIADSLPLLVSIIIVSYYAVYRDDLYELIAFINANFKHHSAQGLTNMTMNKSYQSAAKFARIYTACSMFSVTMYSTLPVFATCKYKKRRSNKYYQRTRYEAWPITTRWMPHGLFDASYPLPTNEQQVSPSRLAGCKSDWSCTVCDMDTFGWNAASATATHRLALSTFGDALMFSCWF